MNSKHTYTKFANIPLNPSTASIYHLPTAVCSLLFSVPLLCIHEVNVDEKH